MTDTEKAREGRTEECYSPFETSENFKARLPRIVRGIVESCQEEDTIDHIAAVAIPDKWSVIELIDDIRDLLYPGYFGNQEIDRDYLPYHIARSPGPSGTSVIEPTSSVPIA